MPKFSSATIFLFLFIFVPGVQWHAIFIYLFHVFFVVFFFNFLQHIIIAALKSGGFEVKILVTLVEYPGASSRFFQQKY